MSYILKPLTQSMRDQLAILMSMAILSFSSLPISSVFAQMAPLYSVSNDFNERAAPENPRVMHPSKDFIDTFDAIMQYDNIHISNSSQGNVSGSIKTATDGNSVYVAWLGNIDGINHVFITISDDSGVSFTSPVELTSNGSGNATNLDIGASGGVVSAAWQEKNSTSGESAVFGSIRYTEDGAFVTSQISDENVTAKDPVIPDGKPLIVIYVIEEGDEDPIERWRW